MLNLHDVIGTAVIGVILIGLIALNWPGRRRG